jgi:glutamyl-tRNA synthetase
MSPPRVRFAPSPTGYLHVGGGRTALFNWLHAKKHGGQFLLRVEDTDKARSTDESTRAIFDGLRWLGLDWSEDVVFQGANLEQHRIDAQRLLDSGHAYRDFTTPDEIKALRAEAEARGGTFRFDRRTAGISDEELRRRLDGGVPFAIRFRVPEGETSWDDLVHGHIAFPNKDIEDFVILRSDRTPVYNHAVVSDDIAMGITLVMRGDDHISNTPKQILLYRALGATLPQFAHLPMIHGSDGKKLSKRRSAAAVADWQHAGILPSAMLNFLALLGWSPGNDVELMSLEEMIAAFDSSRLLKTPSVFDTKKLEWMNGQHIMRTPATELVLHLAPLLRTDGQDPPWLTSDRERVLAVVELNKQRARTTLQLASDVRVFFERPPLGPDAVKLLQLPNATATLEAASAALKATPEWSHSAVHDALSPLPDRLASKPKEVFQPLRAAVTGSAASAEIFGVIHLIGRQEVIDRITAAIEHTRA